MSERHNIMIKINIQKFILILNVYVWSKITGKYVKQKLIELKREGDKSTIKVGDHNDYLSTIDRTARQKLSKSQEGLSNITNEGVLIRVYSTFPKHGRARSLPSARVSRKALFWAMKQPPTHSQGELLQTVFSKDKGIKLKTNSK